MTKEDRILPIPDQRNILITSALPYVNNVPHLGNIVGSVLSADVFSRYNKARGRPTLFVCGTDEYGTATETKALEEKMTPRELCDKYNKLHTEIYEWFDIGFDIFGRTSTQEQTDITQDIFRRLYERDNLVERTSLQPYCMGVEGIEHGFLADRFIEGICPKCGYDDARGDQCDKCGSVDYEALDLKMAHCKVHSKAQLIPRETKHIHIRLDKLQPAIENWFGNAHTNGFWSKNGQVITRSWLKEGLRDRGITRDLKWGTPIPLDVFEKEEDRQVYKEKVFYVWFDACIGYLSITATYTPEWEKWWRDPDNVRLYQFMGKDNVPFHSVIFPGSQLGTGERWTMLHHLSTTEYLNYEDGKFSKSRGVGVFGNNAKDTGVPADVWRYYLLKQRPETADSQFEWKDFIARNNNELLAKLGNFVNRIIKLVNSKLYESVVPDYTRASSDSRFDGIRVTINELLQKYNVLLEAVRLREGLQTAMDIAQEGNNFIQTNRLDNKLVANEPDQAAAVVGIAINIIYLCASIFEPYLPATSKSILEQLNAPFLTIPDHWQSDEIKPKHRINKARYLFTQIDAKNEQAWKEMYGGTQEERLKIEEAAAKKKAAKEAKKSKKTGKKDKGPEGVQLNGTPTGLSSVEATATGGANPAQEGTEPVDSVIDGVKQLPAVSPKDQVARLPVMATLPVKVSRTAFHRRVGRAGIALIPPARAYVAFDTKTQLREKIPRAHRSFSTTIHRRSAHDESTIDYVYMPREEFFPLREQETFRVPLLPDNESPPLAKNPHDEDTIEPVAKPEISTMSASGTHIDSPSALSDVADNHAVNLDVFNLTKQVSSAATTKVSTVAKEVVRGSEDSIVSIFHELVNDVLGPRKTK